MKAGLVSALHRRGRCNDFDAPRRTLWRERRHVVARELESSHANMEGIKGREKKGRFFACGVMNDQRYKHGTKEPCRNSAEIAVTRWI